jgi:hypothetical protein
VAEIKEGFGDEFFTKQGLDGGNDLHLTPFEPQIEPTYDSDGSVDKFKVKFNQAYCFNRTSESQLVKDGPAKILQMEEPYELEVDDKINYYVEVVVDQENFLIQSATFTGFNADGDQPITDFPEIIFEQLQESGTVTGYFPVLQIENGGVSQFSLRENIYLSDRQFKQLGLVGEDGDGADADTNSAHILVSGDKDKETEPVRLRAIQGTGDITVTELDSYVLISGTETPAGAGASSANVGAGERVYVNSSNLPFQFRTITGASSITKDEGKNNTFVMRDPDNSSQIFITGGHAENQASATNPIYIEDSIRPFRFKGLAEGTNITIDDSDSDNITISAAGGATATSTNIGNGAQVYEDASTGPFKFRTLTGAVYEGAVGAYDAGKNNVTVDIANKITSAGSVNEILISGGGAKNISSNTQVYVDGTIKDFEFRGIVGGTNVTVTPINPNSDGVDTDIEISSACCDLDSTLGVGYSSNKKAGVGGLVVGPNYYADTPANGDLNLENNLYVGVSTTDASSYSDKTVICGDLRVKSSANPQNGTYHYGNGAGGTASTSYDSAQNAFVYGSAIQRLNFNSSETIHINSGGSVSLANENGTIINASPATGSAILGGSGNSISGNYNVIIGGANQSISGSTMNFVGGGSGIAIEHSEYSVSAGGRNNDISGSDFSFIGGGFDNLITGSRNNTIGGGYSNEIYKNFASVIAGGHDNLISGINKSSNAIAGGVQNNIYSCDYSFIGAGGTNKIYGGNGGAIVGGLNNSLSGQHGFIGGGENNAVSGEGGVAFGKFARVQEPDKGAFVMADSTASDSVLSSGANTMLLNFKSGVYVNSDSGLYVNGNPVLTGETPEGDTLQTVTDRGATTTNNITISNGAGQIKLQDSDGTNQFGRIRHSSASLYFYSRNDTSNGNFLFYGSDGSDNTELMRIEGGGDVGIGTNNPQSRLHIGNATGSTLGLRFTNPTETVNQYFADDSTDSDFFITYAGNGGAEITLQHDGKLVFNASNGDNVGIGSINPQANLDVTSALNQQHLKVQGAYAEGVGALAIIKTIANGNALSVESATTSDSREIFEVKNSDGTVFEVQGDGKVGIGLTNPAHKLVVSGDVGGTGDAGRITLNSTGYLLSGEAALDTLQSVTNRGNITTNAVRIGGALTLSDHIFKSVENSFLGLYGGSDTLTNDGFIKIHGNSNNWGKVQTNIGYDSTNSKAHWTLNNTTELMTLKGDGSLGIGTDSPAQKLHLEFTNTDTSFAGGSGGDWGSEGLLIENTSSTTDTMAMIQLRNGDADIHIAGIRQGTNDGDLGFFFEGSEKVRITKDGCVGIGSDNPISHKLDVVGGAKFTLNVDINNNYGIRSFLAGGAGPYTLLRFNSSNQVCLGPESSNTFATRIAGDYITLEPSNFLGVPAEAVRVIDGGNVGIGVTNPAHKLVVSGTAAGSGHLGQLTFLTTGYLLSGQIHVEDFGKANDDSDTIVTASDGIHNYNDDIHIPTSAAVKSYVDATVIPDTNTFVNAASFNTSNGVLTLTRNDAATVTTDLDGRFALSSSLGTAATENVGIGASNVLQSDGSIVDDDFLRVKGTEIEGRSASEVLSDIGAQASLTFGISNNNAVRIDSSSVADDEYARFTTGGLESRSTSEVLSDIGAQAEITASSRLNANLIGDGSISNTEFDYLDGVSSNIQNQLNLKQSLLTFGIADTNAVKIDSSSVADDEFARFTANGLESRSASEVRSDLSLGSLATLSAVDADSVTVSNLETDNLKAGVLDTDLNSVSASDDTLASAKAIKTYVDANAGGTPTLDSVTDNGNTTTNNIKVNTVSGSFGMIDAGLAIGPAGSPHTGPRYGLDCEESAFLGGTTIISGNVAGKHTLEISGDAGGTGFGGRLTLGGTGYLLSGDVAGTESDTLQSVTDRGATTTNNIEIQGAGSKSFTVDSTDGHASVVIDRHSTSYDANLSFQTNGATKWRLWNDSNDSTFSIRDEVNASNVMTWEVGGNVGIGTDDPDALLELSKDGAGSSTTLLNVGGTGNGRMLVRHIDGKLHSSDATHQLYLNYLSSDHISMVNGGGNVGIGSNTPSAKLDVAGGIKLLDNNYLTWNGSNTRIIGNSSYLQLQVAASDKVRVTSSGVGIGTNTPRTSLHVSRAGNTEGGIITIDNPNNSDGSYCGIEFINSTVGYPRSAIFAQRTGGYDAELTFHTSPTNEITGSDYPAATERMRIDHDGNVGIGTNSPSGFSSSARRLVIGEGAASEGMSIFAGTSSNASIYFADGAAGSAAYQGFVQYKHGDSRMDFGAAGGRRMIMNGNGLLIAPNGGVFSPSAELEIASSAATLRLTDTDLTNHYSEIEKAGVYTYLSSRANAADGGFIFFGGGTDTEFMRIETDGKVGIGSASPSFVLDTVFTGDNGARLRSTDNHSSLTVQSHASYGAYLRFSDGGNRYWLQARSDDKLQFRPNASLLESACIYFDETGNVGIGVSNPSTKLEVVGPKDADGVVTVGDTTSVAAGVGGEIDFEGVYQGTTRTVFGSIEAKKTNSTAGHYGAGLALSTRVNGGGGLTERLTILEGGNVGIGTNNPVYDLTIGGNAVGSTGGLRINDPSNVAYGAHFSFADTPNEVHIGGITNNVYNDAISINRESTRTITINGSEQVGIGTTAPSSKLEVYGAVSDSVATFKDGSDGVEITTRGSSRQQIDFLGSNTSTINAKGSLFINYDSNNNGSNDNITFARNGVDAAGTVDMVITEGNVGIGTTNPQKHVHIRGSAPYIRLEEDSASNKRLDLYVDPSTAIAYITANQSAQQLSFQTASTDRIRITNGGNVGIGTTDPQEKLNVSGNVRIDDGKILMLRSSGNTYGGEIYKDGYNGTIDIGSQTNIFTNVLVTKTDEGSVQIGESSLYSHGRNAIWPLQAAKFAVYAGVTDDGGTGGAGFGFFNQGSAGKMLAMVPHSMNSVQGGFKLQTMSSSSVVEAMYFDTDGSIGVGTSSPSDKFHVEQDGGTVTIGSPTTSYGGIGFEDTALTAANSALYGVASQTVIGVKAGGAIEMKIANNSSIGLLKMETNKLHYTNGSVGIGLTNPAGDKLMVKGDDGYFASRLDGSTTAGQSMGLRVRAGYNSTDRPVLIEKADGSDVFIIDGLGNVGIGSAPSYELDVSGTTRSTYYIGGAYLEENASSSKLKFYSDGTILVMDEDGELKPCEKENDALVFGVSKKDFDSPVVLGAEPVLVTGPIKLGDYIVTSNKQGHGKAMKEQNIGTIIAQAMESGDGESYNIKAMVRKM